MHVGSIAFEPVCYNGVEALSSLEPLFYEQSHLRTDIRKHKVRDIGNSSFG